MISGSRAPLGARMTAFFACVVGVVFFMVGYLLIAGGEKLGEVIGLIPAGWEPATERC